MGRLIPRQFYTRLFAFYASEIEKLGRIDKI